MKSKIALIKWLNALLNCNELLDLLLQALFFPRNFEGNGVSLVKRVHLQGSMAHIFQLRFLKPKTGRPKGYFMGDEIPVTGNKECLLPSIIEASTYSRLSQYQRL